MQHRNWLKKVKKFLYESLQDIDKTTYLITSPVQFFRFLARIQLFQLYQYRYPLNLVVTSGLFNDRIEMINSRWTNHRDLHQKPSMRSLRNYVIYMFVRMRLVLVDRYQELSTTARNSYKRSCTSKTLQESETVDRVNDTIIVHLRNTYIYSTLRKDRQCLVKDNIRTYNFTSVLLLLLQFYVLLLQEI